MADNVERKAHAIVGAATVQPLFAQEPHLRDPSGSMAIWYTQPAGVVMQLVKPCEGSLGLAQWLATTGQAELARRFPTTELTVVFDVRAMTGRDARARLVMIERAKQMQARVQRLVLLPPRAFSPALRRTMEVTVAILRVFGVRIEIAESPSYMLATLGLSPLAPRATS